MPPRSKNSLIDELIQEYRAAGNQDDAFDSVAAAQLGVSETDLRCLNIIENERGLTAGELARGAGLTAGAVTGVIDRLEQHGYARRVPDPSDRRRVRIEVTQAFYRAANQIWGPVAADWHSALNEQFASEELELVIRFLRSTSELGREHMDRLRGGAD
jgi:DNA-binding MarR family transcriptional regulator